MDSLILASVENEVLTCINQAFLLNFFSKLATQKDSSR